MDAPAPIDDQGGYASPVSQVLRETALGWLASPAKFEPIPAATVQAWVEAALADAQAGRRSALLLLAGYAASANSTVPN